MLKMKIKKKDKIKDEGGGGKGFQSIKQILAGLDLKKDKYISREFQKFGYNLAVQLNDLPHKSLYIKLAKEVPRPVLERALSFVKDSQPRSKARLFMWKLKDLQGGKIKREVGKVYIGTSGFSYPHWGGGVFYPKGLPQSQWLKYYARHFKTVELNVSFYRLPKKETFEKWRKVVETEGEFVFSLKGWRWITHVRKLKDCQEELEIFFEKVGGLSKEKWGREMGSKSRGGKWEVGGKKGSLSSPLTSRLASHFSPSTVILWQLPPSLTVDSSRLEKFLALLPTNYRYAFEFRNESWLGKKVFRVLQNFKAAAVFQDYPDWPRPQNVWPNEGITAEFVYLRFHGREALYTSGYSSKELGEWGEKIKRWRKQGLDVYGYFNNDALGYAVRNAKELYKLTEVDLK